MIHFDNIEFNVVKVIFVVSFDGEIVTQRSMKSAGWEGFIGCTKKYTVYFEGSEEEVIYEVFGAKIFCLQLVDDFGTHKHDKY